MAIGRMRRTLKRSLSIAMAAALMATSVPQYSVTTMAQEEGRSVQQEENDENASGTASQGVTEEENAQSEDSDENATADETTESTSEEKKDSDEAQETDTEQSDGEKDSEEAGESETDTDEDDSSESEQDEELETQEEKKASDSDKKDQQEEEIQGTLIYKNDFESNQVGDKSDDGGKTGTVVQLGDGNQAMEYDVDLQGTDDWEEAFATSYALSEAYETPVKEKLTMAFDIYIPDSTEENVTKSVNDFGTMKLQIVLNDGDDWKWYAADSYPEIKADGLTASDIEGYSKMHISIDISGNKGGDEPWELTDLTSLRAVTIKAVGAPGTYKGKLYIDNVVLKDTSAKTEEPDPEEPEDPTVPANEEVFYENDFDTVEKLADVVNVEGSTLPKDADDNLNVSIAELADGNKAIKFTTDLSNAEGWEDIFKAEIDLSNEFAKTISDKVVMSYDLYFPAESVGEDFGVMTPMAALKSGENWTWITQKSWPSYPDDTNQWSTDDQVTGYKVFHVEIDMNDFETWDGSDNVAYPFEQITPIKAVIPCLAGNKSNYKGDIYLDNLKVKAVGVTSGDDNPPAPDDPGEEEKPLEGELIYKQDFNELSSLENVMKENVSGRTPELADLAEGNKAVKYTVSALSGGGWDDIFKAEFKLDTPYEEAITDKVIMSYDVYFPSESVTGGEGGTFDSMKAQAALKSGAGETWVSQKSWPEFKAETLVEDAKVPGFKKAHIVIEMNDFETWDGSGNVAYPFEQITPIKAVIPCFAGAGSTYAGDIYLDNLEVRAVSSEEEPPTISKELIYENDFNELSSLGNVLTENVSGRNPELAELASGNKAVKYSVQLGGAGWEDIFKAQFNLSEQYDKPITEKVVMSYDIYFPSASVAAESFVTIKGQATVASGSAWDWATQKTWPEITVETLEDDTNVPDFKKAHVEIDMNDLQVWDSDINDNKPYPFDKITPIQAVIPCLAGAGSTYTGDLYLDNLKVWAVNESGETPEPTEDVVLELDASAWQAGDKYQYKGESKIENRTVGDKKFLAVTVDYSQDTDKGWSEPKFDYVHPEQVSSLKGYNAFIADVYYKPANKTAGSFGIKLYAKSPVTQKEIINSDAPLPEGEAVDIPGLEGYYKAQFVLEKKYDGAFQNLTFSIVGKNTDYVGDFYLDNMRFTKITAPDIYVDSTILPEKGAGIQVVDNGRNLQTASGQKTPIAENVALVDAKAIDATKNLYAYLKAVGESDSVIFGHQNDTHHKAGSMGEEFSTSDTKDVTGSIAGVVGIDVLSLTGNEASTWDAPEADRIANLADITRKAAAEGALITVSAHMPNFEVIDQRVKAFDAAGGDVDKKDSDKVGYWTTESGEKQYNFSGYTPGTTTGNVVQRIMPGQDLNYLYTDYLDLIADYAKAVEGDGITILFRPFHENTGSWFWWGAAFCDEQAYINLFRYTVDYMKETKGVHNMLYVYGPGSEAANVTEYSARYPGDDYVDMIGYDLYHSGPTQASEPGYLQSISKQNQILRDFAEKHNKLYAITETGVADGDVALKRTGNEVMDWYMQLLDQISKDGGICYFLVWANFDENGSFYLPYVIEKKENGVLHGHEMLDEFIRFYNDERSVFATDMNSGFQQVTGVTNTTKEDALSGYIITPQSGDRILPDKENPTTRIAAKVSGIAKDADNVWFVVETEFDRVTLKAAYNEEQGVWEAVLKDSALLSLGEALGTITLFVGEEEVAAITAKFNMEVPVQNDMIPEDFEGYNGDSQQLGLAWATNKASGSEISFSLTDDPEKVFGGAYGLKMDVTFAAGDAWAGATKGMNADWSAGNALEFYTIPETKGQKVVIQVTTGGNTIFETYLQEFEGYTDNAQTGFPVKVTIPFSAFVGRDNKEAKFDAAKIESIGLWCNAIPKDGLTFPLSTTLYYDEFKIVTTDKTVVEIEPLAKKGIWIKDIPAQVYTGKAVKPEVQVYDDAKLLTLKKDYTVSYKNNTKKGSADVIIKGKGNYAETITGHFDILPKQVGELTITAPDYLIYNEKEQNISVTVKDGKKKLSGKNDYTQTITFVPDGAEQGTEVVKAKEAGTYNIKIAMKGNYEGEVTIPCKMVKDKELLTKAKVTLPSNALDYKDGAAVEFEDPSQIIVKLGSKVVPQKAEDGTDNYKISYENHKEVGTASVVITGVETGKYVGSCSKTFTIKGTPFSAKTIEVTELQAKMPYTGRTIYQNPVLIDKASKAVLEKNVDYRITYANNRNAGKATMTITGLNKYSGTIKQTFTIDKVELTAEMLQQDAMTVKQNRAGVTPDVELIYEGRTLVKDVDYKLTYTNNKNTTTDTRKAYISIAGKGNFKGSIKDAVKLTIEPKSWDSGEITVEVADMKYKASTKEYKPNPVVYDNGRKLTKNKDYTVAYASNKKEDIVLTEGGEIPVNGHTASVIITLTGSDYVVNPEDAESSKQTFDFLIISKLISEAKIVLKSDKTQYFSQYGTRPGKDDLIVTYRNTEVKSDEYDIISYSKNDKKGSATLVVQGKGQYGGTKKVTFKINARGMNTNLAKAMEKIMSAMMEQL
ncbi:MAG: hypothetical protein K2N73_00520 [Lachnospiraceae bacterium]|nr:hypothetical protein [Lachnospiraceae bacterium]